MKNIKSYLLVVMVCMFFFGICVPLNMHAFINCNGAGQGYEGTGKGLTNENGIIAGYIIEGAGFYLAAKSDVDTLLKMVELKDVQGLDYKALNIVLNNAITMMKNAVDSYEKLVNEAENIPYNNDVQAKLKAFDYNSFISNYRLNPYVWRQLSNFLQKGNILAVLKKNHRYFARILEMLYSISNQTSLNKLPEISMFWELNEGISETSMFGSYVARVFDALHTNK